MKIDIKTGDTFETRNPMALGFLINGIQFIHSKDNKADTSHSGIIIDPDGTTFEAGIKVPGKFFHVYGSRSICEINDPVKIWRYTGPCKISKDDAIKKLLLKYQGRIYPYWRMPLFIIPWIAKFAHFSNKPVCSELKAMFYRLLGAMEWTPWGVSPDNLNDRQENWKHFELVFDGLLSNEI